MAQVSKKIGLLHHMSGANLGDAASFNAVMQNIKRRWPDAAIFGFSMNPEDTRTRHGIPSYPIRQRSWGFGRPPANSRVAFKQQVKVMVGKYRLLMSILRAINAVAFRAPSAFSREILFLIKSFRIIRSFDLLIITGGGQLVESSGGLLISLGGPWQFPFTIFKWILLARLAHVRSIVLNVGAGPLSRPLSKWFIRRALFFTDYASFRDEESRALVHRIGFKRKTDVFPDSVYSLVIPASKINPVAGRNKTIVGFAPMAYGDPRLSPEHDPGYYNCFIQWLGMFGSWLIKRGYCLTLFCTDISLDPPAVEDMQRVVKIDDGSLCRVHQWTTEELLVNMSSMDYVVACRFHAVVFAHMLNIPVLAINHHPKVKALMHDLGLSEYCVDIGNCDLNVLIEKFSSLVNNRDEIKSRMSEKQAFYKRKLSMQFDELFPRRL